MNEAQSSPAPIAADPAFLRLRKRMTGRLGMRLYMLAKLPLGLFAGLRIRELTPERCAVSVPYGWRSTNPFKSTYFAAQAMAAEMSTGALALAATELASGSVAMLIVGLEAQFGKKATSEATFICEDGVGAFAAVEMALASGEPQTWRAQTVGRLANGDEVSRFVFTWSFKRRSRS